MAIFALCSPDPGNAESPAKLDPPVVPKLTGTFTGNGKPAAIKFVLVEEREPFSDEPAIKLLFTESDPAKSKNPSLDAMFGKLGSSLSLSVNYSGEIFGCEVSHNAHEKKGFSSVGRIKMTEFKIAGGNVIGHVSTGGELDAFGEKWEVELTFAAPLPTKLRDAPAAPARKETAEASDGEKSKEPGMPAAPAISAYKLPIPSDATGMDYKKIVGQIHFTSGRSVAAVTKEISANLKRDGWMDGGGSLEGKANSILKREQGAAKLTIMIHPAAAGCTVKIFTEGLDWTGGNDTPPPSTDNATRDVEKAINGIEADVQKQLDDALKNFPR